MSECLRQILRLTRHKSQLRAHLLTPLVAGYRLAAVQRTRVVVSARFASSMDLPQPPITSKITASKDWWCCTATATASLLGDEGAIQLQRISGYENDKDLRKLSRDFAARVAEKDSSPVLVLPLDLTKSPDWMEFIEITEHRRDQEGGAGAYDTMRCDLELQRPKPKRHVWGKDFHLQRLQRSYRSLLQGTNVSPKEKGATAKALETSIQLATDQSERMIEALLQEAEQAPTFTSTTPLDATDNGGGDDDDDDVWIRIVRLTLLWSRDGSVGNSNETDVVVQGHACASSKKVAVHSPVEPIVCTIAATQGKVDAALPSRHSNPQNKVAKWTRLRKTMEEPERYKPAGVSEVLMVRSNTTTDSGTGGDCLELLEGLSSNVFVVYRDGSLRTAETGVLHGYVRHLVLECAEACGLVVDSPPSRPIMLHEAPDWKEAFITSSSRLIFPISKILVQQRDHNTNDAPVFVEYWRDPVLTTTSSDTTTHTAQADDKPKWQQIYDEILRRGGYPPRLD